MLTTHGKTETPEYTAWCSMKRRCSNPSEQDKYLYKERGIKVCDRWLNSFENFLEDMGTRPSDKHSIDRIDVNGDYEPTNCRWADQSTQAINQRIYKDNKTGIRGVSYHKQNNSWRSRIRIGKKEISLGYFKDFFDACCARKSAEAKHEYANIYLNR